MSSSSSHDHTLSSFHHKKKKGSSPSIDDDPSFFFSHTAAAAATTTSLPDTRDDDNNNTNDDDNDEWLCIDPLLSAPHGCSRRTVSDNENENGGTTKTMNDTVGNDNSGLSTTVPATTSSAPTDVASSASAASSTKKPPRVAIIGAGPSGLAVLRAFRALVRQGDATESDFEVVCFEKQDNWGGTWKYTDLTGLDECGEPVHTSMYRHLVTNGPKEDCEFPEYTFDEHFGRPVPSYPPRKVYLEYLDACATKNDIRKWCQFRSPVRWVQSSIDSTSKKTGPLSVSVQNLVDDRTYTESFDYVVVASGHYAVPNVPLFQGWDTFPGPYLHSHDFRNASHYKRQHVLLVGGSVSAEDLALQCWKFGAASVTISYRSGPIDYDWPEGIDERPLLTHIQGRTVTFSDNTSKDFDTIILCTGYKHHFPFLPDELRLKTENKLWVSNLYQGVVWMDDPRVFYMGMQEQCTTIGMFDAQGWYVRDVILGRKTLPSKEEMIAEEKIWLEKESELDLTNELEYMSFQSDYVRQLVMETDYPKVGLDGWMEAGEAYVQHRNTNILTYRDQPFPSFITGTMATVDPVPWTELFTDSEAYERKTNPETNEPISQTVDPVAT